MMTDCKTMERLWGANVIRKNGFGPFPLLLLRLNDYLPKNKRMGFQEERVLWSLVSYRNHGYITWPKPSDIKRDSGMEFMYQVRNALKGLEEKGLIRIVHVPHLSGKKLDHFRYDLKPCVETLKEIAKSQLNTRRRHCSVTRNAV